MNKLVEYHKRYVIESNYLGSRFVKGETNNLRRAKRIARRESRYHPKVTLRDTWKTEEN